MKLRIPMNKTANSGLRKLSNKSRLSKALEVLGEAPNLKKDMWIKRAKEYEKNINSGDPVLIAEVVRDLHKTEESLEQQSYSERQIYLTALNRLSNEYAAVQDIDKKIAKKKLEELLNASP
jgi:CarD family transcriptional regulator